MRPGASSSRRGGRSAAAVAALALAFVSSTTGGCSSAPPPASAFPALEEGPFAFRDPRDGAPQPPLERRDEAEIAAGVDSIRRGDLAGAVERLAPKRRAGTEVPPARRLAEAYLALAEGKPDVARPVLAELAAEYPKWRAAVEADADLAAAEGRLAEALERYRALLLLAPSDRRARGRVDDLRIEVAATKKAEAEEALRTGDLDSARRAAHSLLQLEPSSGAGLVLLARAAMLGGKADDAWTWANEARNKVPADRAVAAFAAEVAAKAGRWADAAALYMRLAASDPAFLPKEEEARLEFKIQNLPETARRAAESARLTRAQLASLLWWTIPEVRDALVPPGAGIAVDVVDRHDRSALVKAIGLGFFSVSTETHRVGAESAVTRSDLASALRRVALLAGRGRPPKGCLSPETPPVKALADCGILNETPPRSVTGREALRALEKAARLGREGGTR